MKRIHNSKLPTLKAPARKKCQWALQVKRTKGPFFQQFGSLLVLSSGGQAFLVIRSITSSNRAFETQNKTISLHRLNVVHFRYNRVTVVRHDIYSVETAIFSHFHF